MIGEKVAAEILFVCSGMWKPYFYVIAERCINALHILGRFHIMAKMSKALDEVRAQETKRLIRDGYQPLPNKSRWCVLKRKENLTDKQQVRLRDLLRYNLQTVRAYLLKEDFQQFWTYTSPVWAGRFLDFWCHQVMRSRIEPMKNSGPQILLTNLKVDDKLESNWMVCEPSAHGSKQVIFNPRAGPSSAAGDARDEFRRSH